MTRFLLSVAAIFFLVSSSDLGAQRVSSEKLVPSGPRSLALGATQDAFVLLPSIPFTFAKLEKDDAGEWRMGATVTTGLGATVLLGKGTYQGETMTLQPWITVGGAINAGVKETPQRDVKATAAISGFAGFSTVALSFTHDFLDGANFIGISTKLDLLTDLAPDKYICLRWCPK